MHIVITMGVVKKVNKFENLDRDRFKQQYHRPTISSCNIPDNHMQQLLSRQGLSTSFEVQKKKGSILYRTKKGDSENNSMGYVSIGVTFYS